MVKLCIVHGCNEPRFRKCTRCHEHQKEQWNSYTVNKPARVKTDEQAEHRLNWQRNRQQAKLLLERGACAVEGCGKPCAKRSTYCMAHRKELGISTPKRNYNIKTETVQVVENMPILADLPRLIVIDSSAVEYIEYVPVKRVKAKSKASLKGVTGVLTSRKGWIVMGGDDNG